MLLDIGLVLLMLPLLAACGYLLLLSFASRRSAPPPVIAPQLKFDIIVPAHNEELGIARTVRSLAEIDYPVALRRIVVIADNCTDGTADRAREAGAVVLERRDSRRGKGFALAYGFEHSLADKLADAVVVVDADTVASPNLLHAFAVRLKAGAQAVQACYGVLNSAASWRTELLAIALGMFHQTRSLGRERLGLSCGLRGNGMCFTNTLIREVPHDAFSIVEDLEYGLKIGLAGYRVHYAHDAKVLGEMATSEKASRSQRSRWEGGRKVIAKQHFLPVARQALVRRSWMLADLGMDLLIPPLSTLASASMLAIFAGLGLSLLQGRPTVSLVAGFFCALSLILYGARGFWLSEVGWRGIPALAFAPIFVGWKIFVSLRQKGPPKEWVRTTRQGEPK